MDLLGFGADDLAKRWNGRQFWNLDQSRIRVGSIRKTCYLSEQAMSSKPVLRIDWATHEAARYACEKWHYSRCV